MQNARLAWRPAPVRRDKELTGPSCFLYLWPKGPRVCFLHGKPIGSWRNWSIEVWSFSKRCLPRSHAKAKKSETKASKKLLNSCDFTKIHNFSWDTQSRETAFATFCWLCVLLLWLGFTSIGKPTDLWGIEALRFGAFQKGASPGSMSNQKKSMTKASKKLLNSYDFVKKSQFQLRHPK